VCRGGGGFGTVKEVKSLESLGSLAPGSLFKRGAKAVVGARRRGGKG
jgi:hypothetical protein